MKKMFLIISVFTLINFPIFTAENASPSDCISHGRGINPKNVCERT